MIFIFDWGHETRKVIGPLSQDDLYIKAPSGFVDLVYIKSWFRVFFIPTIPTATRYFLIVAENNQRREISKADFEKLKPLAELNVLVVNDDISEEEYSERRSKINHY
ncbi:hypothetical protein G3O08_07300 [Cryomorpha ignava]|uniref:Uncharacterized protein n=1 Tax=Cryomorpha ignava TaxID=101383 RepID=A0A7K3WR30_9FLAO|nr:hypothetical protein [Cryomorpha ignava]NEN23302.1 hypothetical protein [Cryomorpha ignava]